MKYFTKYLPVEGEIEIKKKTPLVRPDGKFTFFNIDTPEKVKKFKESFEPKGYKPAKLFLCNRDIQIGDKITYMDKYQGTLEASTIGKYQFTDQDGGIHYLHLGDEIYGFKVIGEISPEATWVKEGDEFEEEDVKCYKHLILKDGSTLCSHTEEEDMSPRCEYANVYQIKGPCGHFH